MKLKELPPETDLRELFLLNDKDEIINLIKIELGYVEVWNITLNKLEYVKGEEMLEWKLQGSNENRNLS